MSKPKGSSDAEEQHPEPSVDSESVPRPAATILELEIRGGLAELQRSARGLLLSGLSAGLDIGFGPFLMVVLLSGMEGEIGPGLTSILMANIYAIGFVFVVLGRSELFTEHTVLAVLPVMDRRAKPLALGRLWALVYLSNLAGCVAFSALASIIGGALGVTKPEAFLRVAAKMVDHPWWVILVSAVLAGWLMGLLSWLLRAARETISQLAVVWVVTASIGLGQLHHCIAGSVEVLMALFAGTGVTVGDFGHFLLWSTLGNAIGGFVFVGAVKFGQARGGGRPPPHQVRGGPGH